MGKFYVWKDYKVILDVCILINYCNDNKYCFCYRFGLFSVVVMNIGVSFNIIIDVIDICFIIGVLKVKFWVIIIEIISFWNIFFLFYLLKEV